MASKKKQDKQDEHVEVVPEQREGEQPSTRRPKKVAALGKKHRSGDRHRASRSRSFFHLLDEEKEEEDELS